MDVPVEWKDTIYFVSRLSPGSARIGWRCWSDPVYCTSRHPENPCGSGITTPDFGAEATVATAASDYLVFDVTQLAQVGGTDDPTTLSSLDALSLVQLEELSGVLSDYLSRNQIDEADANITLVFADGSQWAQPASQLFAVVAMEVDWRQATGLNLDVNMDSRVDVLDWAEVATAIDDAAAGLSWPSRYDVNGDTMITSDDECIIINVVVE